MLLVIHECLTMIKIGSQTFFLSTCLLVLLSLQYKLWFMEGGIIPCLKLKSAITTKEQANQILLARNNRLTEEIKAWKTGSSLVESHARYELGMIKNGEVFYRIVK